MSMQIEKSVQVIRLNAPGFNPVNVTRMSLSGAEQKGGRGAESPCHPNPCGSWLASDRVGTSTGFID